MMSGRRMITFDDFARLDIRVGRVVAAEVFPEARKPAYRLRIDFGGGTGRQEVIRAADNALSPDELVGRLVLAVVNFPPRQIGPFMSEVLTLGVPDESGAVVLVTPDRTSRSAAGCSDGTDSRSWESRGGSETAGALPDEQRLDRARDLGRHAGLQRGRRRRRLARASELVARRPRQPERRRNPSVVGMRFELADCAERVRPRRREVDHDNVGQMRDCPVGDVQA